MYENYVDKMQINLHRENKNYSDIKEINYTDIMVSDIT